MYMHYNHCHRATAVKYIIIIIIITFVVYFVNYIFRACLGPSSGGTTACIQHLVLSVVLDGLESIPSRTTDSLDGLYRIVSTQCCIRAVVPPDDGLRCARNV